MQHYLGNIEKESIENTDYRRVVYTSHYTQLVLMSIEPGDEIGSEVHGLDQFVRAEQGTGKVILNGSDEYELAADHAVIIPAGMEHNVVNVGEEPLKLYSLYSLPEHKHGTVHTTKADEKEEHFDGVTSHTA
jgi:mannose-6-phosphate isomerase-like protein (cupin superfamily)